MKTAIVTGGSRGLGEALTMRLLSEAYEVFCISRSLNNRLEAHAAQTGGRLHQIRHDLSLLESLDALMASIFAVLDPAGLECLCLINNAGTLAPIKPAGKASSDAIIRNLAINAQVPILLSSAFIGRCASLTARRTIINISSGAAKKPYRGWSCYCSAKAAIDMFTRCAGLEQAAEVSPIRIFSFAPGIIDTGMQAEIRSANPEDFEQVERFRGFKENGSLRPPDEVAAKVIALLENDSLQTGLVLDIRDMI